MHMSQVAYMLGVTLPVPVALKGLGQRLLVQAYADESHILRQGQPCPEHHHAMKNTQAGLLQTLQGLWLFLLIACTAMRRQSDTHGWNFAVN